MSSLRIYNDSDFSSAISVIASAELISKMLADVGVRFERWPTKKLEAETNAEQVLAAYSTEVNKLKTENGFTTADVIRLTPDHPQKEELRKKFLDEHTHTEDEIRFFVEGQGIFYLHLEGKVYIVTCTQNDLISVPDGTRHWFDMGPQPDFTCIRLFTNPEGWVAQYTGDDIASKSPRYEALAGAVDD
jgi:1,2-dihydroxy-3-keto-5-methylthiopentene dioxygenase